MLLLTKSFFSLMYCQRFFCGGRLIFGPDVASLFLSTLLIVGPGLAFCIKIHYKIKEDEHDEWYFIMAVGAILTILVSNIFSLLWPPMVTNLLHPRQEEEKMKNRRKMSSIGSKL